LVAIAIYGLCLIVLGYYASGRIESQEDYLVAGRKLPLWLAWGTLLATWFGAGTVIGASEAARDEGLRGTLLDPFASGLALIVAGLFFARPMWNMQLLTMGDYFARSYGPRTETVSSVVQAISYFPWLAAQFVALGGLLSTELGWPAELATCVAAVFVLYLTVSGGMWSVTLTDTAQAGVLLIALVILGYTFFADLGQGSAADGLAQTWQQTPADMRTLLPPEYALAWLAWTSTLVVGVLGNIPGQDLMQRVFSARSARVAAQACLLAGCVYLVFGLLPVLLGLASRIVLPDAETSGILNRLAVEVLSGPMRMVFVLALLSIVVSTATSALLSPAALLARNVFEHVSWFRRRSLATDRGCVVACLLVSLALAFAGQQVLGLLEQALEISLVALLIPFLAPFVGSPRGDRSGVWAIVLGAATWGVHTLGGAYWLPAEIEPQAANLWQSLWLCPSALLGLAASFLGYTLGQLSYKK
jgi:SSS family solute:Na+ symporter